MEKPSPGKTPVSARPMSIAHLAETCIDTSGHIQAHVSAALAASDITTKTYHETHADRHTAVIIEHLRKLIAHLKQDVPGVSAELGKLGRVTDPDGDLPPLPRSAAEQKAYVETERRLQSDLLYPDPR